MKVRHIPVLAMVLIAAMTTAGCGHLMMMLHGRDVMRPAAGEFGTGPRRSAAGLFTATLDSDRPLRPRQLQTVRVAITDASGHPVDGAAIVVDGGMPEHGHGLPTRPRVTRAVGAGLYEIDGVRFNMGGWWEFTLAVDSAAGSDVITFNLDL